MQKATLKLPFPPSVNHVWRRKKNGGMYLVQKAALYRADVYSRIVALRAKGLVPKKPISGPVGIRTALCPPDRRKRDLDNYAKALYDALTHARVWNDDSQVMREEKLWLEPDKASAGVEIVLEWN